MYNAQGSFAPHASRRRPEGRCAPRTPAARADCGLAPCIALIGCDGSGKSTLTQDIVARLDREAPTRTVYLGLGTGDLGRRIGQLPLIGPAVERYLTGKAKKTHSKHGKIPGPVTALAVFAFSLARYRRFRTALRARAHGIRMVTDRYPQAEVPGAFDGPGLSSARAGSPFVAWLARKERALYDRMAAARPTLVVRLNVDADTALARKPDHPRALLEKKIAVVPTLRFNGAPIVDIDATRPYAEVRDTVLALLRERGLCR